MTDSYPNLGFDPTPGMPEAVESLHGKIQSAVNSMTEANSLMGRLRNANDAVWQGDAGNAFREHFNTKLVDDLNHAHESLGKAVGVIQGWHGDLVNFKDSANRLEAEAAEIRKEQQQAEAALKQAQASPDLQLAGKHFDTDAALKDAQSKLDAAESAVHSASSKANEAADKLKDVIRRAKELQSHHEDTARKAAQALKDATQKLAPHEPGLFSKIGNAFSSAVKSVGDWTKSHLKDIHSVLSTISTVAGFVALVTPPPVDAVAFGVSACAAVGTLAVDAADPQFRHGIGQLVTGHFNKDSLGALKTGAFDAMGAIPAGGALGKTAASGIKTGAKALGIAEKAGKPITEIAREAGHNAGVATKITGHVVKGLEKLPGGVGHSVQAVTGKLGALDGVLSKSMGKLDSFKEYGVTQLDRLNVALGAGKVAGKVYSDVHQAVS